MNVGSRGHHWKWRTKPGRLCRLAMVARCDGNVTKAARLLGMHYRGLHVWLVELAKREGAAHLPVTRRKGWPRVRVVPKDQR